MILGFHISIVQFSRYLVLLPFITLLIETKAFVGSCHNCATRTAVTAILIVKCKILAHMKTYRQRTSINMNRNINKKTWRPPT